MSWRSLLDQSWKKPTQLQWRTDHDGLRTINLHALRQRTRIGIVTLHGSWVFRATLRPMPAILNEGDYRQITAHKPLLWHKASFDILPRRGKSWVRFLLILLQMQKGEGYPVGLPHLRWRLEYGPLLLLVQTNSPSNLLLPAQTQENRDGIWKIMPILQKNNK